MESVYHAVYNVSNTLAKIEQYSLLVRLCIRQFPTFKKSWFIVSGSLMQIYPFLLILRFHCLVEFRIALLGTLTRRLFLAILNFFSCLFLFVFPSQSQNLLLKLSLSLFIALISTFHFLHSLT